MLAGAAALTAAAIELGCEASPVIAPAYGGPPPTASVAEPPSATLAPQAAYGAPPMVPTNVPVPLGVDAGPPAANRDAGLALANRDAGSPLSAIGAYGAPPMTGPKVQKPRF